VGCGIYDLKTPAEFDQAIAIARGTPACPLTEPEDLFDARIVGVTPKAASYGIQVGMTGREAVELMLRAEKQSPSGESATASSSHGIQVKSLDHVTIVVKDLERSRRFYVDVLGMRQVARPGFSFDGLWFQAGKTQIHLILEFAGSGPAGNLLASELRSSRTQHFAFEVADAEAVLPRLREMSVPVLSGPKPRPDGYMQVFVTDPDGHVVELCSPPKAA
jgi:catechol 2,3-dioxygenase-like lactoylglutathione lyase family enzyme